MPNAGKLVDIKTMTSPEIGAALTGGRSVVLLPVGSVEQHSMHLPVGTDTIIPEYVCAEVAKRFDRVLVAPSIQYGTAENHDAFPGTVNIRFRTLVDFIVDVGREWFRQGADALVIVGGHGGNIEAAAAAAHELRHLTRKIVIQMMWTGAISHETWGVLESDTNWHADELETSVMLYVAPEATHVDRAVDEPPPSVPFFTFTEQALLSNKVDIGLPRTEKLSRTGVIGQPSYGTAEKGRAMLGGAVDGLSDVVEKLISNFDALEDYLCSRPGGS